MKILWVSLVFCMQSWLFAGVQVAIEPKSGQLGTTFALSLQIEGSLKEDIELPDMDHVRVVGQQTQRGMTMGFGQGMGMTTTLIFHLQPTKAGSYEIPHFIVHVDDQKYEIQDVVFDVTQQRQGQRQGDEAVFLDREQSSRRVYVGQPFLDTLLLHSLPGVLRRGQIVEYQLDGARAVQTEKKEGFQKEVNGTMYDVVPVHYVVIPGHSGTLTLPPHRAELSLRMQRQRRQGRWDPFDDFFQQNEMKEFWSGESQIEVLPLPSPAPPDFSGLVGDFSVTAQMNKSSLQVGETATLTLTIEGDGELSPMGPYSLEAVDGLKFYADQPEEKEEFHQFGIQAMKTFKFAVVPAKPGSFRIQPPSITIFDPKAETYRKIDFPELTLEVQGQAGLQQSHAATPSSTPHSMQESVSAVPPPANGLILKDLVREKLYQEHGLRPFYVKLWCLIALTPWILQTMMALLRPVLSWRRGGRERRRAYRALRRLKSKHTSGPETLKRWNWYLNTVIGRSDKNLNIRDMAAVLEEELYQQVEHVFLSLESWAYGVHDVPKEKSQQLITNMLNVAQKVEKAL